MDLGTAFFTLTHRWSFKVTPVTRVRQEPESVPFWMVSKLNTAAQEEPLTFHDGPCSAGYRLKSPRRVVLMAGGVRIGVPIGV
ncbi:hypothetical protein [Deinococcus peraridilitoris]|uniref:Uncharacterized protein n=1 Tax=Deinococcus peraridilitoris (strain DSM 19664 / LMG 22246 / CIP 109416 / KR-200) TaxID=937777 RepID=L0A128_DEIPD|nr:hypothetical protein [Deinococcus peraridilitoris]AFZ66892.1 hypothetical protein Deipe_1343 [Deinococcus peraridilitoris DSM 19664]